MMNEQVRQIMTKDPMVASPDHSIEEVTQLMLENRINQLPVVVDGKLVGLVTTYDLWKDSKKEKAQQGKTVSDVMTTKVIKITPLDKVGTAAELFMDKRYKTLPVVNLRNELKGVVTSFDVLRHALTEEYPRPILYTEVFENK
jgi:CBS domain-containing protein